MILSTELTARAQSKCELCSTSTDLVAYTIPPKATDDAENQIALCSNCLKQIGNPDQIDSNHMRCINESMWSQVPAVQVMSYRLLKQLETESWAQDLLGMIYMDDATLEWAESGADAKIIHKDSNGNILQAGDTVTLIQDLNVKGGGFTAKRGTAVRRIRLVHDNAEHIEGKVDGQQIVILTKFIKKS